MHGWEGSTEPRAADYCLLDAGYPKVVSSFPCKFCGQNDLPLLIGSAIKLKHCPNRF